MRKTAAVVAPRPMPMHWMIRPTAKIGFEYLAVQNSSIGDLVPWSVCLTPLTIRVFTTLQSEPRDLSPWDILIRVMRRHDLTKIYLPTCLPTYLCTSIREHPKGAIGICDIWDTDYNADNWEPRLTTIFVIWQLFVTLDSIRNSCDVLKKSILKMTLHLQYFNIF